MPRPAMPHCRHWQFKQKMQRRFASKSLRQSGHCLLQNQGAAINLGKTAQSFSAMPVHKGVFAKTYTSYFIFFLAQLQYVLADISGRQSLVCQNAQSIFMHFVGCLYAQKAGRNRALCVDRKRSHAIFKMLQAVAIPASENLVKRQT